MSEKQVECFRTLYHRRFGEQISKEEALEKGVRLVLLVQLTQQFEASRRQKENTGQKFAGELNL